MSTPTEADKIAWQELFDDQSLPAEHPGRAIITYNEFMDYLAKARAEGRLEMRAAEAVRQFVLDWHNISQDEFIAKYRNYPRGYTHAFSDYAYRLANLPDHPETKEKEDAVIEAKSDG